MKKASFRIEYNNTSKAYDFSVFEDGTLIKSASYDVSQFEYAIGAVYYYIQELGISGEVDVKIIVADSKSISQQVASEITNEDVIRVIESYKFGIQRISGEMDDFIKKNYKKCNSDGRFYKVYREGNDSKYGHYMVNPRTMCWRNSTFDEFYAGGIVD